MTRAEAFLLKDLQLHGPQGSWDWTADARFAAEFGPPEAAEVLDAMLASTNPTVALAYFRRYVVPRVTRRRLEALRRLAGRGHVDQTWVGMGHGGRSEFGTGRTRRYSLREGRDNPVEPERLARGTRIVRAISAKIRWAGQRPISGGLHELGRRVRALFPGGFDGAIEIRPPMANWLLAAVRLLDSEQFAVSFYDVAGRQTRHVERVFDDGPEGTAEAAAHVERVTLRYREW